MFGPTGDGRLGAWLEDNSHWNSALKQFGPDGGLLDFSDANLGFFTGVNVLM